MSPSQRTFQISLLLPPPSGFCRNCFLMVNPQFHLLYHNSPLHARTGGFALELKKECSKFLREWHKKTKSSELQEQVLHTGATQKAKREHSSWGSLWGLLGLGFFFSLGWVWGGFFCTKQGTGVQLFHSQEHHCSQRCLCASRVFQEHICTH